MIITGTREIVEHSRYVKVPAQFSITSSTLSFVNGWEEKVTYSQKPVISWEMWRRQDNAGNWYSYLNAHDYSRTAWYPYRNCMECVEASIQFWDHIPNELWIGVYHIKRKQLRSESFSLELDEKGVKQWEKYLSSLSFAS